MACSALQLISTQRTTVARVTDGRRPPQQAAQGVEGRGSFGDERGAREAEPAPAHFSSLCFKAVRAGRSLRAQGCWTAVCGRRRRLCCTEGQGNPDEYLLQIWSARLRAITSNLIGSSEPQLAQQGTSNHVVGLPRRPAPATDESQRAVSAPLVLAPAPSSTSTVAGREKTPPTQRKKKHKHIYSRALTSLSVLGLVGEAGNARTGDPGSGV